MRPLLLMALVSCLFAGCATPYQSKGFSGGFSETQLAPDVFWINFAGNEQTSGERVAHFALLRAAEVALANDFPYFVVEGGQNQSTSSAYVAPGYSQTYGTVTSVGNQAMYNATTTTNPAQIYNVYKPGVGLLVRGLKYQSGQTQSFDAAFLVRTLKAKYNID